MTDVMQTPQAGSCAADFNASRAGLSANASGASVTAADPSAAASPATASPVTTAGSATTSPAAACAPATDPVASAPRDLTCDVVIVGCGVGGLYTALKLPSTLDVVMLSKGAVDECDSMLAQGGICVLADADDYDAYVEDTLRAGHYENRLESVDVMVRSSRAVIDDLVDLGVDFERTSGGALAFTREGAHSRPRICYHADITGEAITTALLARVRERANVRILEHTAMIDLLDAPTDAADAPAGTSGATPAPGAAPACAGVRAVPVAPGAENQRAEELTGAAGRAAAAGGAGNAGGEETCPAPAPRGSSDPAAPNAFCIYARATVLACGGIGGLYERSTNFPSLTGDACRIAERHGAVLEHMDYVQIHPTSLYAGPARTAEANLPGQPPRTADDRAFLISESCRGEGAVLWDDAGERFCDELQPRDVVTAAIRAKMAEEGSDHVRLSFEHVPAEVVRTHFAHIYERCLEEGYDITREPVPVVPAQHYFMGGIHVDVDGRTGVPGLFAVGETSCTGVHGKNRLASNSLLEALVWARRAAQVIASGESLPVEKIGEPALPGEKRA